MPARARAIPLDGDGVLDLDARRAARAEKSGPKQVRIGGRVWTFKAELPMQVATDATSGNMKAVFERLLVDGDEAEEFLDTVDPSQDDFAELVSSVYNIDLGKL